MAQSVMTSITVVKKFTKEDGTFFKFEKFSLPATISGEGASEIIFSSGITRGVLIINGCPFDYSTQSLQGENISQNFQLETAKI